MSRKAQGKPASKKKLSDYSKKKLLAGLKQINCHPDHVVGFVTRFNSVDKDEIKKLVDTQAKLSQNCVTQMLNAKQNKKFQNLEQTVQNLKDETSTDHALPVTLEAISRIEHIPPPEETGGIDLKLLYKILANLTAGYPVEELSDGPTKQFLRECYTEVMESVSEDDARNVKESVIAQDNQTQPVYSWLCNSDYSQYLEKVFKDFTDDDKE